MRIALFSDVHGNLIALNAVLEDIKSQGGADAFWVLGDLVAIGYDPARTLERLVTLPSVRFASGNTDRYVVTGERPPPTVEAVQAEPSLVPKIMEIAQNFAWTQGYVTAAGWLDWLAELPLEQRLTLPNGTRLLGVHAAPGTDDGTGVYPGLSDGELQAIVAGCRADLVCVGHTHWPVDRSASGVRVVNLGSVSNPWAPDLRASYVLLKADASGYRLQHRRVDYERQAVIKAIQRSRHPAGEFMISHFSGQRRPHWEKV